MQYNPHFNRLSNHHHHQQIHQFPLQNTPHQPIYTAQFIPHFLDNHGGVAFSEYEQKLRNEVIYLHSLWHKGPPHKKKKPNKSHRPNPVSDKEWPVSTIPISQKSPSSTGWAQFKPSSVPNSRPATADEKARILALKVQLKGLESCIELFKKPKGENSGEDNDDDGDDDDEDDDDYADDCDEEFEFLLKVFEVDDELRGYYEKNCEDGEFYCLVCGVIGSKFGRKYRNCVALVQHLVSVSKTRKKKVHRAFGHVVCKVLGWDINRLPSLPLMKSGELQGDIKDRGDGCNDSPNVVNVGEDSAKTSDNLAEPKDASNAVSTDNFCSTNEASNATKVVLGEGNAIEREGGHASLKRGGVCIDVEHVTPVQENILDSEVEVASKMGEECSPFVSNSVDCAEGDAYKFL